MKLIDADKLLENLKWLDEYDHIIFEAVKASIDIAQPVEAIPIKWIEKFRNQFDEADDFYDLLDTMLTIWKRCKEENDR